MSGEIGGASIQGWGTLPRHDDLRADIDASEQVADVLRLKGDTDTE